MRGLELISTDKQIRTASAMTNTCHFGLKKAVV